MGYADPAAAARRSPEATGERVTLPCDSLIAAIGEKPDAQALAQNGVELAKSGRPTARAQGGRIFVAGDALRGPATVVEAIADALAITGDILGLAPAACHCGAGAEALLMRRGAMQPAGAPETEFNRCMGCDTVCLACVDVCPNRANEAVWVDGDPQIIHIDGRCNECGNCATFCPYDSAPYLDKLTWFVDEAALLDSQNPGWTSLADGTYKVRLDGRVFVAAPDSPELPAGLARLMRETLVQMPWLAGEA